uniref:RxLR effector candidate protein n=1 Tax=Hyaloperonospora arabidopsidis (strain Emoy2) TaxID=559515 RepID=M4BPG9_HYAAE
MGSTRLLLVWSVFFASTFDLVLTTGNLKGVQHFQDDSQTIRQLGTVPMVDEQESTTDNEEERQVEGIVTRMRSFGSHVQPPHIDEQTTLRVAEAASQRAKKMYDDDLEKAKTVGIVAKEEPVGHYEQYHEHEFKLEVLGFALAVLGMVVAVATTIYTSRHPK